MPDDCSMCSCGRAGAPTKPVQFRVSGTATRYKEKIVRLCERCRKGRANRGRFRLVCE
jgi:hypothetical protein